MKEGGGVLLETLSLIWGILAMIATVVFLIPCFGAFNWINIPFSGIGLLVSIAALITARKGRKVASVGAILCTVAILIGILRLIFGFGMV